MSSTTIPTIARDVGALISYALQRERPSRNSELRRIVNRYQTDDTFRQTANETAAGQGLTLLRVDELVGVVVAATGDSIYAPTLTSLREQLKMPETDDRLIYGMIFAGIAAWCYPTPQSLDDLQVRRFTASDIDQLLRTLCSKLNDEQMAIEDELDAAWQAYDRRKAIQRTKTGRLKTGKDACTMAMIEAAAGLLTTHRLLKEERTADGNTRYHTTDRFRLLVRNHSSQLAYRAITDSPASPEETGQQPSDMSDTVTDPTPADDPAKDPADPPADSPA